MPYCCSDKVIINFVSVSLFLPSKIAVVASIYNPALHHSPAQPLMGNMVAIVLSRELMPAKPVFPTLETPARTVGHLPQRKATQSLCRFQAMLFFLDWLVLWLLSWVPCKIGLYNMETKRKTVIMNIWARGYSSENHVSSAVSSRFHYMAFLKRLFA